MALIALGVFAAVLLVVYGAYWAFVVRPEQQDEHAVRSRLKTSRAHPAALALLKQRNNLSSVGGLDRLLVRWSSLSLPLQNLITQSGLKISVGVLVTSCVFVGLMTAFLLAMITRNTLFGLGAGLLTMWFPYLFVRFKAKKRLAVFEEQFPEAIDLMARALRAGHALPTALQMAGEEIAEPVGGEFRLLFEQQNYGLALPDALRAFSERVQLLDARFFVTAVLTQREMGGNLSEVLDKLAAVIRERFKVKRQVRVVSAHGRITGVVLGCLPPAVAGLLFLVSPEYIRLLSEDALGIYMVATALFLQIVGVLIIRRIVDVEY
jgi:tight adherence protein B